MSQIDNDFLDDIFGQFEGIEDEYDEEALENLGEIMYKKAMSEEQKKS